MPGAGLVERINPGSLPLTYCGVIVPIPRPAWAIAAAPATEV